VKLSCAKQGRNHLGADLFSGQLNNFPEPPRLILAVADKEDDGRRRSPNPPASGKGKSERATDAEKKSPNRAVQKRKEAGAWSLTWSSHALPAHKKQRSICPCTARFCTNTAANKLGMNTVIYPPAHAYALCNHSSGLPHSDKHVCVLGRAGQRACACQWVEN
jgi:hypothetical protein